MRADATVIVVGGAIAGGALANALGQTGIDTLVLEKGFERDNSTRGDFLHPPTLHFLDVWGVLPRIFQDGALPIHYLAVSHRTLGRLATYDVPAHGQGLASRTIAVPHDRIEAMMQTTANSWPSVRTLRATATGLIHDGGRVVGVRANVGDEEREFRGRLIVGCDGGMSVVRREARIGADRQSYGHDFVYIQAQADGPTDPPAAIHFCLDELGVMMVASRPRNRMRIVLYFARGARGNLLKQSAEDLNRYIVRRIPWLEGVEFTRDDVHVYAVNRSLAEVFWAPGVALVGDAAHQTHPTGATGMNLAISGAARLVQMVEPLLKRETLQSHSLDEALAAYAAERRPAAAEAIAINHDQAGRIWMNDAHRNPEAYVRNANPAAGWGVDDAGWGQNPAALALG